MARQRTVQQIIGMGRDRALSRTAASQESFENRNIRISATDEDNTLTAITNEKGTSLIDVTLYGTPNGTFVCNEYLGIFSHDKQDSSISYITVYKRQNGAYSQFFQYTDNSGELNFSDNYIETIVSVESSNSIRVYWIDGVHEMRVIDILKIKQFGDSITNTDISVSYFSYLPTIERIDFLNCTKLSTGYFYSGTVQFVITELINGNESNIVHYTPLYYVSNDSNNRGFAPDNTNDGIGFNIQFKLHNQTQSNISQFIVYCIYRSSKDSSAIVYKQEINTTIKQICSAVFTGEEQTVDSTYLSFKNTKKFTGIQTFVQKDNTLFIGNYNQQTYDENIQSSATVGSIATSNNDRTIELGVFNAKKYSHISQLKYNSYQIGHFKTKETYILGHQLMDIHGAWSEPIFDKLCVMDKQPSVNLTNQTISLSNFYANITFNNNNYIAARPVIAYISDARKRSLCQGFVTPTIFCEQERDNNICYAKASPFTRTMFYMQNPTTYNPSLTQNVNPPFIKRDNLHHPMFSHPYSALWTGGDRTKFGLPYTCLHNSKFVFSQSENTCKALSFTWLDYGSTHVLNYPETVDYVTSMLSGTYPASQHFEGLGTSHDYNCEFQNYLHHTDVQFKTAVYPIEGNANVNIDTYTPDDTTDSVAQDNIYSDLSITNDIFNVDNTKYYVDAHVVTFHSPDILSNASSAYNSDSKIQIVGAVLMNGFASDVQIVANTPWLYSDGTGGFIKQTPSSLTSGRCAMTMPLWCAAWASNGDEVNDDNWEPLYWAVSPFNSEVLQARNNMANLNDEVSKLTYKQLSNYRYSPYTTYYNNNNTFEFADVTDSEIHYVSGENGSIAKIENGWYRGYEDVAINASSTNFVTNLSCFFDDNSVANQWREGRLGAPILCYAQNRDMFGSLYCATGLVSGASLNIFQNSFVNFHGLSARQAVRYRSSAFRNKALSDGELINHSSDTYYESIIDNGGRDQYEHNYVELTSFNGQELTGYSNRNYSVEYDNKSHWGNGDKFDADDLPKTAIVNMKYLTSPHLVINLGTTNGKKNILPNYGYLLSFMKARTENNALGYLSLDKKKLIGSDDTFDAACPYNIDNSKSIFPYLHESFTKRPDALWLVDIINNDNIEYTEDIDYNATTPWYIAGETVWKEDGNTQTIKWVQGNWYFQRWENLHTYAESIEDKNQVTEIISLMLETRTNIDGRYDANGGYPMLNANKTNFGLINDSYSQQNNFFSYYRTSLKDNNQITSYPNTIAWSLPKTLNSEIDTWTSITGQSYIDMDGDKGDITKLVRLHNNLFCFQAQGIAEILYNSRVQISTEDGTPIEMANSGNVEGKRYISNMIGAQNKRQVCSTDSGIYFADTYNKALMLLSDSMHSLSETLGFHSWTAQNANQWLYHMWDAKHKSIVIINQNEALSYSETLQHYESFFDYGNTFEIVNVQNDTLLIHQDTDDNWKLWLMNGGEYNNFFGVNKNWYVKYAISTAQNNGQKITYTPTDKIWDNIEFRGDAYDTTDGSLLKTCPYNYIRAETEYQDSEDTKLTFVKDWHQNISNLKQKFRIWHCIIPRDAKNTTLGRIKDRIRNPWVYLTLGYKQEWADIDHHNDRAVIQDFYVDYFE